MDLERFWMELKQTGTVQVAGILRVCILEDPVTNAQPRYRLEALIDCGQHQLARAPHQKKDLRTFNLHIRPLRQGVWTNIQDVISSFWIIDQNEDGNVILWEKAWGLSLEEQ